MMYSGQVRTRAQGVAVVRSNGDEFGNSQHQELNSPIIREPNKAAVKLNLHSSWKQYVSSKHSSTVKSKTQLKSQYIQKGSNIGNLSDHSIDVPDISMNSETHDFYKSQLSLEWPADQSLQDTSGQQQTCDTNSMPDTPLMDSSNMSVTSDHIRQLSPPPPLPKLRPINIVDPVLSSGADSSQDKLHGVSNELVLAVPLVTPGSVEIERLQAEVNQLKKDLDSQIKVNAELKKMLVASMGDDLQYRMERLARDKIQLSQEVGQFSQRVTEDYEELDKISIQADMWRSKYMASKVMVDELASWKAHLQMRFEESEGALLQLIEERHQLNRIMAETHGYLKHIRDAFEPASAAIPMPANSLTTLMLTEVCKTHAENIHIRLLPGGKSALPHTGRHIDYRPTQGETMATQIISSSSSDVHAEDVHPPVGNMAVPRVDSIPRFHPLTRYENFTIPGCSSCHGDIKAV